MKRAIRFAVGVFFVLTGVTVDGQDFMENLLRSGPEDATKLMEGYIKPVLTSASLGMNQGWYNTAKTHKPLGFDLSITINSVFVNDDELTYKPNTLGLQNVTLVSPADGNAPTIYGPKQTVTYAYKVLPSETFTGPKGLNPPRLFGKHILPVPIANIGIGIIKGTDLKFRFMPNVDIGTNNSIKLFGIGLMHDVKQYIPVMKNLPIDLSIFGAYTKLDVKTDLSGTFSDFTGSNQYGYYDIQSWTVQALVGKKISFLTLYGGVGYNNAKSDLKVGGTYNFSGTPLGDLSYTDPVNISVNSSGPRITGGFSLKFAVFTLQADYTIQKKSVFTAGFGFSVR